METKLQLGWLTSLGLRGMDLPSDLVGVGVGRGGGVGGGSSGCDH